MTQATDQALQLRRLRYRVHRLGMLELEAWLARLDPLLEVAQPDAIAAASGLMELETVELLAIMHGERPLPAALQPWFDPCA